MKRIVVLASEAFVPFRADDLEVRHETRLTSVGSGYNAVFAIQKHTSSISRGEAKDAAEKAGVSFYSVSSISMLKHMLRELGFMKNPDASVEVPKKNGVEAAWNVWDQYGGQIAEWLQEEPEEFWPKEKAVVRIMELLDPHPTETEAEELFRVAVTRGLIKPPEPKKEEKVEVPSSRTVKVEISPEMWDKMAAVGVSREMGVPQDKAAALKPLIVPEKWDSFAKKIAFEIEHALQSKWQEVILMLLSGRKP